MSKVLNYYESNQSYTTFLESQEHSTFKKYARIIRVFSKVNGDILDVGCGTGISLELLQKNDFRLHGTDISKTSIKLCAKKGLDCKAYSGDKLPYKDRSMDTVGSYNVLEHTDDPIHFLDDSLRLLKDGGYLIVACPNFLSITNSYHWRTKGFKHKMLNIYLIFSKLLSTGSNISKMETIVREDFHPDDDACNLTNPIDILHWAHSKKLKLMYWSSRSVDQVGLSTKLDKSFFKLFLGSSFMVYKK